MITKEQALRLKVGDIIHHHFSSPCDGKYSNRYRINGRAKTWKTRPDEFAVPLTFGLRGHAYLTESNASEFHLASGCKTNPEG